MWPTRCAVDAHVLGMVIRAGGRPGGTCALSSGASWYAWVRRARKWRGKLLMPRVRLHMDERTGAVAIRWRTSLTPLP